MNSQKLALKQIDAQLKAWKDVSQKYPRPRVGWIKTLRKAIYMSAEQLGLRLGVNRVRIQQIESAEINEAITVRTLKAVAEALGCEFVYAIVPKGSSSLTEMIHQQAALLAEERIKRVSHTMSLEDQAVNNTMLKEQKEFLIKNLTEHLNKKFWANSKINGNKKK